MKKIKVLGPKGGLREAWDMYKTIKSGWWGKGPRVAELEQKFAKKVGKKYAIAVDSCTSALDLALKVYDIEGGELITTPMTFASTALVGFYNNMDVTFADIKDDYCIDPASIVITPATRAIIVVHSHGTLADIKGIRKKWKGLIIEDCAHCGGMTAADKIGQGDIQCWSFQAVKTWPSADGGMITTDNKKIYEKLKPMTWCGIKETTWDRAKGKAYAWDYVIDTLGYKKYMNDITATLVLSKFDKIDKMNARRREIADMYSLGLSLWYKIPYRSRTYQYYTVRVKNRDEIADYLAEHGISTSVHFKPLSEHPLFRKCFKPDRPLPMTNIIWQEMLTLPIFDGMTNRQVRYIIKKANEAVWRTKDENIL